MTRLAFAFVLIAVTISQGTILSELNVLGIAPNLALVLLLVWASTHGVVEALIWAFPLGLLFDLVSVMPLGSYALALAPVAVIGGLVHRPVFHSGLITPMGLVVVATLASYVVSSAIGTLVGTAYGLGITIRLAILAAFLNMIVVPPLYVGVLLLERLGVGRAARA